MCKLIIAGSRGITNLEVVREAVNAAGYTRGMVTEIVSGTARGVDRLGEELAAETGIPVKKMPADWDKFGRSAGYKRNWQMVMYADALVAVWDGESKGTGHMIKLAQEKGLRVPIHYVRR